MPIHKLTPHAIDPTILVIEGTPDEVYGEDDLNFVDVVAGLTVAKVSTAGKHDGYPATIIHLADDMGSRELGRLVVRHDVDFREEIFTWERFFQSAEALDDFVAAHRKATLAPVASVKMDLCWDDYLSVEHAIGVTAAKYGVSLALTGAPTGNPWPEVQISGLRENVRRCLVDGWQLSPEDAAQELNA